MLALLLLHKLHSSLISVTKVRFLLSPSVQQAHLSLLPAYRTLCGSAQVNSISALIKAYGWREIVPICEDTDFGRGIIPFIVDALQEIGAHVPYRSVIPVSLTNDQTMTELYKLMTMRTRVFIVHMSYSMDSIHFSKAKEAGMMSKGYAWIMTDALANIVDSIVASTIIYTMQGASGVKAVCTQIEGA